MSNPKFLRSLYTRLSPASMITNRRHCFHIALGIGLLVVLAVSLMLRPLLVSTAQEKTAEPYSEASSLIDALRTGIPEAPKYQPVRAEDIINAPNEVCGWTAGTVHPVTILDQATVSQGGFLYTFGGVSTAIIANARKFDGTTWTDIAPLPAALEFPTAVSDGTNIYILGGALTGTGTPQTTLYRYNVATNDYTTLAPFTTGTWNQAAAYLGGKIYKFAGTGPATASTNVLEIYDVAGNTWTAGAPYPLLASFVSAFTQGGFVYGAGGIQSVGSVATLKTYRYDPVANTWDDAAIADLPLTRWGAASSGTAYGSGAAAGWVLAGGYENGTATANISTTVIRWNSTTNAWTSLASMPGERARMTGAQLGGSFYVIGGRSVASAGFVGTNSNHKLACIENVAVINQGAVSLVSESFPPGNGAPDPGEVITVSLPLINTGDIATTALTAMLQATGGVTNPSAAQNYGAVPPAGGSVSKNFTFRVNPLLACGASITLTWTVADGATNYTNATKMYVTGNRTVTLAENFDGVTAPALPAGWVNTQTSGTGISWTTTTTTPSSGVNAAFANDPATVNAAALSTPAVMITSADAQITFKNKYITESTFDGTVLEYSTDGGTTWTDVIAGGGTAVTGGYNATISTAFMNPIGGRMAWSGTSSGGYIDTVINLPASLNGQSVKFRWLTGSDNSVGATGQWVDDVQIFGARVCNVPVGNTRADFDGDGKTDVSVFRPGDGNWYLLRSTAGFAAINWGLSTDTIIPGDYDGDNKADTAVFRGGNWLILNSSTSTFTGFGWGFGSDVPVAGDYDGDGKTDAAVYRPGVNTYYVRRSTDGGLTSAFWGSPGDIPVVADFDGDNKTDFGVFRSGTWHILGSTAGYSGTSFGLAGDKLVPADYDGDNKDDIAVVRGGIWYLLRSSLGFAAVSWGLATDIPVPGDYDGDGKDDQAVYRDGNWYLNRSTAGFSAVGFGIATDRPVPKAYIP